MQAAATGRLKEHTPPADDGRAVKKLAVVHLGPGEIGLGGDSIVEHPLPFVGIDVDAPTAALLFAGVSSAIGLLEKSKRNHLLSFVHRCRARSRANRYVTTRSRSGPSEATRWPTA